MKYMAHGRNIAVEVIYAMPDKAFIENLRMPDDATVEEAIRQSGLLQKFPEINLDVNRTGIFSRPCSLDTQLQDGDRVEIYRPLRVDPKEARRRRAEKRQRTGD